MRSTASGATSLSVIPFPFWFTSGIAFPTAAQFPLATGLPTTDGVPFQGDFDGDGQTDLAFYDLATATWYMDDSKTGLASFPLGTVNSSVPVVGYFNANLPEEAGVYTFANGQGTWSVDAGNKGVVNQTFPASGQVPAGDTTIPVPGDYTGVGYDELAVYVRQTGQFLVQVPGTTTTLTILPPTGIPDLTSLVPVPGNYNPHLLIRQPSPAH